MSNTPKRHAHFLRSVNEEFPSYPYPSSVDLTEDYKRRNIYRHVRGCGRWLEAKLPNCIVTETIEQEADGWIIELTVRPRTKKG